MAAQSTYDPTEVDEIKTKPPITSTSHNASVVWLSERLSHESTKIGLIFKNLTI
jgi:hypothetical protein